MSAEHKNLLRTAFDAYLVRLYSGGLDPLENYLPYDFDQVDRHQWQLLGDMMVKDELREITNILNQWEGSLHRWQAWNAVIGTYGEDEAWELRREFLEALAHRCLLQPSATRDAFTFIATNSMHQVLLALGNGYRDYLKGDPKTPEDKPRNLTRRQKEQRLSDLIVPWHEAKQFMAQLRQIDDVSYRETTSDYRNRSSHTIGPRLAIGDTQVVTRTVVPSTKMTKQVDGTFIPTPIPGKMAVEYGLGGTSPLDMEEARIANLNQYYRARTCYEHYRSLLAAGMAAMPAAKPNR